jgi:hypothetical protein
MTLGVDLDGVVVNFTRGLAMWLNRRFHAEVPEVADSWYWYRAYITKAQEALSRQETSRDGPFWYWLPPEDEGVLGALARLEAAVAVGTAVFFVSSRPATRPVTKATIDWLRRYGITDPQVILGQHNKGALYAALGVTHAIDDRPAHIRRIGALSPDTRACLKTTPYSRLIPPDIACVTSLADWVDQVCGTVE